jgi:hypothetical protein
MLKRQLFIWPAAASDNFFIGCHSRSFNGHFRHSWITFSPIWVFQPTLGCQRELDKPKAFR